MKFPEQTDVVVIDAERHSGKEDGGHAVNAGNVRRQLQARQLYLGYRHDISHANYHIATVSE